MAIASNEAPIPPPNESTIFPNTFEIDYIRVFQRHPQAGFSDLCQNLIVGPENICDFSQGNTYMYNLIGIPSNVSVSNNLSIVNNYPDKIEIKAFQGSSAYGWIKADYPSNEACGQISSTKNIWIGPPPIPIINTITYPCDPCFDLSATCDPLSLATFQWNINNGSYSTSDCATNIPFHFPYAVTALNQCGSITKQGFVYSPNCHGNPKWIIISPDPVEFNMSIELQNVTLSEIETLKLLSNETGNSKNITPANLKFNVDVSNFKRGIYHLILKIKNRTDVISESVFIRN